MTDPTDPARNEDALFKSALGPTGECPRPELLAAAGNPEVQRHLASCSRCRTELAMLLEFEKAEPRPDELAGVKWIQTELRRRSPELTAVAPTALPQPVSIWERLHAWVQYLSLPHGRGMLLVAAASLLVMVTAGVYLRQGGDVPRPSPSAGGADVWRSGQFAAVSPVGDVAQSPAEFRWEAVPGAAAYQIRLMEVDGAVIWSSEVTPTSVEIPHNVRSKLAPGRAFQWEVVARSAAGERIASTVLQNFHILANSR
jgi:hypothetical protein